MSRSVRPTREPGRPRVVVVGAGFAGLAAVRALRKAPVEVLLIDAHNYHLFTPLLYEVASALLDPSAVAHPIRGIVRGQAHLDVRLATVMAIDLGGRELVIDDGGRIEYDFLVLAAGSVSDYFGSDDLRDRTFALKDLDDALRLRNAVLARFEEAAWIAEPSRRLPLLTFAVIGGGPTGVEYAGALSELVRLVVPKDFPSLDLGEVRILLIDGEDGVLSAFPVGLREAARQALERKGIELVLSTRVKDVIGNVVHLTNEGELAVGTVVWAAGVRGAALGKTLGLPIGPTGRLAVTSTLQLADHPEVFVVGDLAAVMSKGRPLPMLSPVAIQEGKRAARNIAAMAAGRAPAPFRYVDRGTMATIGRNAAVAQVGPLHVSGRLAWFMWLFLHLVLIISFRDRLAVLMNWAWSYLFLDRPIRLMTGEGSRPATGGQPSAEGADPDQDLSRSMRDEPGRAR